MTGHAGRTSWGTPAGPGALLTSEQSPRGGMPAPATLGRLWRGAETTLPAALSGPVQRPVGQDLLSAGGRNRT